MRILVVAVVLLGPANAWGQAVPCGAVGRGDLVINEILFDAPGGLEFVEVVNRASCSIGLNRIALSDSRGTREVVATSGVLDTGVIAVFASSGEAFAQAYPDVPFQMLVRWPELNNGGDAVVVAVDGATVDSVFYESSWGVPGRSIERRHPDRPSLPATSWGPSSDPSGATPGSPNSLFAIDGDPPHVVYAEEEPGNVVYVRLSEPALASSVTPERFGVGNAQPLAVNAGQSLTEYRLLFEERPLGPELWTAGL
ncbi:MAG TPA: lamin tail domain-containing protein, partial [Rhodothermales bacterium]